ECHPLVLPAVGRHPDAEIDLMKRHLQVAVTIELIDGRVARGARRRVRFADLPTGSGLVPISLSGWVVPAGDQPARAILHGVEHEARGPAIDRAGRHPAE